VTHRGDHGDVDDELPVGAPKYGGVDAAADCVDGDMSISGGGAQLVPSSTNASSGANITSAASKRASSSL
jgi:hypothetical protein